MTGKEGPIGPSLRHAWEVASQNVDRCARCGRNFHRVADAHGPSYCESTPAWMAAHPEDDGGNR